MFEIMYRVSLKPGKLEEYQKAWKTIAQYMMQNHGAVASRFYAALNGTEYLIHSRWPNRLMNSKSWPLPDTAPHNIHEASAIMGEAVTRLIRIENYSSKEASDYISNNGFVLKDTVTSAKKQILIYNDEGCGTSAYEIAKILRETVDLSVTRILTINADHVNTVSGWEDNTRLFIIPGGRARPYYTALGSKWEADEVAKGEIRKLKEIGRGNLRIKKFVEEGGSYLGICAGGYYGAEQTVFEKGGRYEVLDEGALGFFPGIAEGPAYGLGKFEYASEQGSELAKLNAGRLVASSMTSYFNGGSFFTNPEGSEIDASQVLAHYSNITTKEAGAGSETSTHEVAAIVENFVGKGRAILSGVHFEYLSDSPDELTPEVRSSLAADDPRRRLFVAEILNRLGVPIREEFLAQLYVAPPPKLELAPVEGFSNQVKRERFAVIDSTQTYAEARSDEVEENNWRLVTADQQKKGIGTHGRAWLSPVGNIYATFSTLIPTSFDPLTEGGGVPHIVALSVLQVLKGYGLDPKFKWVNDVLLNNKKVAGILCRHTLNSGGRLVLHIGIGLNVDLSAKECEGLSQPATSLLLELKKHVDKEEILVRLQQVLAYNFFLLFRHGYSYFVANINANMAFIGEEITFDPEDSSNTLIKGIVRGVADKGALILASQDGKATLHHTGRILRGKELLTTKELNMSRASAGVGSSGMFTDKTEFHLKHFESTDSTQVRLKEECNSAFADHDKVAYLADEQTAGIGTIDPTTGVRRNYISFVKGDLYVTFGVILPPERAVDMEAKHPLITQMAALAAIRTLAEFGIAAEIKWRNDLRIAGEKAGGVLCELQPLADGRIAGLIGIGINVNRTRENCDLVKDQRTTSMMLVSGKTFAVRDVYNTLAKHLSGFLKLYFEKGMSHFLEDVRASLEGVGKTICVTSNFPTQGEVLEGEYLGINETGCLQLKLADGSIRSIKEGKIDKVSLDAPAPAVAPGR